MAWFLRFRVRVYGFRVWVLEFMVSGLRARAYGLMVYCLGFMVGVGLRVDGLELLECLFNRVLYYFGGFTQRLQNPLIKEYFLNYKRNPNKI